MFIIFSFTNILNSLLYYGNFLVFYCILYFLYNKYVKHFYLEELEKKKKDESEKTNLLNIKKKETLLRINQYKVLNLKISTFAKNVNPLLKERDKTTDKSGDEEEKQEELQKEIQKVHEANNNKKILSATIKESLTKKFSSYSDNDFAFFFFKKEVPDETK